MFRYLLHCLQLRSLPGSRTPASHRSAVRHPRPGNVVFRSGSVTATSALPATSTPTSITAPRLPLPTRFSAIFRSKTGKKTSRSTSAGPETQTAQGFSRFALSGKHVFPLFFTAQSEEKATPKKTRKNPENPEKSRLSGLSDGAGGGGRTRTGD